VFIYGNRKNNERQVTVYGRLYID